MKLFNIIIISGCCSSSLLGGSKAEWSSLQEKQEYAVFGKGHIKNRYSDILPYEHSRVILKRPENNSDDYINANYVSIQEDKKVILTQSPRQESISDFWWMIWENGTENIGMFTNFVECRNGAETVKAMRYWNTVAKQLVFSDAFDNTLSVKTLSEDKINGLEKSPFVRKFELSYKDHHDDVAKVRIVSQFHYLEWPDQGVPYNVSSLISYLKETARFYQERSNAPFVFHCSAGVGRAGVMAAMLRHILTGENIFTVVKAIRQDRQSLVQTEEQYQFLYNLKSHLDLANK